MRFAHRTRLLALALVAGLGLRCASSPQPEDARTALSAAPAPGLSYQLSPAADEAGRSITVTLSFDAGRATSTVLQLPNEWEGQKGLHHAIRGLRAEGKDVTLEHGSSPDRRILQHPHGGAVTVRYEVFQETDRALTEQGRYLRPIVHRDHFHLIGEALWVHPLWNLDAPRSIEVKWKGFPAEYKFLSSVGLDPAHPTAERSIRELKRSLFLGGDYKVLSAKASDGRAVRVALHGALRSIDERSLADAAAKLLEQGKPLFGPTDVPELLVSAYAVERGCCFRASAPLARSVALFVADGTRLDPALRLELARRRFDAAALGARSATELGPGSAWITEGFGAYFGRALALRAELIDLPEYVRDANAALREYRESPARSATGARLLADAGQNPQLLAVAERRGDLLAQHWNARLRARGTSGAIGAGGAPASLDSVVASIFKAAREESVTPEAFQERARVILAGLLGDDAREEIRRHVDQGRPIEPDPLGLGPCVSLEQRQAVPFDLGFDQSASTGSRIVIGVRPNGPAWNAGLRNGQTLLAWDIAHDPSRNAVLTVVDSSGRELEVTYPPAGERVSILEYALDPARWRKEPASCLAWLKAPKG